MSFAGKAFLLIFVGYILWVISEPLRLHYREKYRGRRLGFGAKLLAGFAVIILVAIGARLLLVAAARWLHLHRALTAH